MADQNIRLAAIVAADMANSSRAVAVDNTGTVAAVGALRIEVVEPLLQRLGGRSANTAGNTFLLEFPDARVAVGFCIEFQIEVAIRNARLPVHQRVNYRIGLTVGNIIVKGHDFYGDAVEIATRLQAIAKPGSICISEQAYENVRSQLYDQFVDGGKRRLQNISRSIQVWHWSNPVSSTTLKQERQLPKKPQKSPPRRSRIKPPANALPELIARHRAGLHKAAEDNPFIVFLCGPTLTDLSKPSAQFRFNLQKALESEKFEVVLGEDDGLEDGRLSVGVNAQDNELEFISTSCNAVVLIADSVGAFCELGLFSWHFVHKGGKLKQTRNQTEFFLLLDEKFKDARSYLKEGPTKAVNGFGTVMYVDFQSFDVGEVLARMRDRRGVMIVDNRRGRPRKTAA